MGQKGSGLKNIKYLRQFSHISSRITLSLTQICLNPVRLTKNDRKKEKKIIKKNIFQGLSSENGVRYSRYKAKNATFYYKMLHNSEKHGQSYSLVHGGRKCSNYH